MVTYEAVPLDLSGRYIEAHNRQDLDGLMDLVDESVEFKRAFDPPLKGRAAVRLQYEKDWADHKSEIVYIREMFEANDRIAIEIQVDSGPPSNLIYDGMIVHHWNEEGRLVRSQLYVDEVASEEPASPG
jgi:ketosteroid isomerase-like protein